MKTEKRQREPDLPFGLQNTKKSLDEFSRRVSGTTEAPLVIHDDAEADVYAKILLTRKSPSLDPAKAREASGHLTEFPAEHFGSYTVKFPNTNRTSDRPAFFAANAPEGVLGVADVANTTRRFSGIGNAENSPAYRFLAAIYRDGSTGEVTSMLDDLLQDGPVARAIRRLTDDEFSTHLCRAAEAVAARRGKGCDVGVIGPENTVILWPIGGGDYTALTPVTNMALVMELDLRMAARRTADPTAFFPSRAIKVGGTQPQNAGINALDRVGWFRLLKCDPPPFDEQPFHLKGIDVKLLAIIGCRWLPPNQRTRLKRDRLVAVVVGMVVKHLLAKGTECDHRSIMQVIRVRRCADLNDYEAGRFSDQIDDFLLKGRI